MRGKARRNRRGALSFVGLSLIVTLVADIRAQAPPRPARSTTYYLHGRIYTNDPKHPWAEAMAVREDKIFCVGTLSQVLLDCGGAESSEVVQLNGRFVMPGFNDAHVILGGAGRH